MTAASRFALARRLMVAEDRLRIVAQEHLQGLAVLAQQALGRTPTLKKPCAK